MIKHFTIQEVEILSGIKTATLRMWEKRYGLYNTQRLAGNKRHFSLQELEVTVNIALLKRNGFQISRLAMLEAEAILKMTASLLNKADAFDYAINRLVISMFSIETEAFEIHLNRYFSRFGVIDTLQEIIIPFQKKINRLTKAVNSSEVVIAMSAIKRKIIYFIESAEIENKLNKTALLFLPKGEHDDLMLLYMCYVLKISGYKTLYLGSNVPEENIIILLKQRKPDHLFTYVTEKSNLNMPSLLSYINEEYPEQKLHVIADNEIGIAHATNTEVVRFIHFLNFNDKLQSA